MRARSTGCRSYDASGFNIVRWFDPPCLFTGFEAPPAARMHVAIDATPGQCSGTDGRLYPVGVDYPYVLPKDLLRLGVWHPYDPAVDPSPNYVLPTPPDPGADTVTSRLAQELDGPGRGLERDWLDWDFATDRQPEEDPATTAPWPPTRNACTPASTPLPAELPARASGYTYTDPRAKVMDTFSVAATQTTGPAETATLYWGDLSWGYRHIMADHGYGVDDAAQTRDALANPSAVTPNPGPPGSYRFYKFFTAPDGTPCTRRVIVRLALDDTNMGFIPEGYISPQPIGIISSFAYPTSAGDPGLEDGL